MKKAPKHSHRSASMPNDVPRSATFKKKAFGLGENHTFSGKSKKKS